MQTDIPSWVVLEPMLRQWLLEDIGRGDMTTQGLCLKGNDRAEWIIKEDGVIAGLEIATKVFELLNDQVVFDSLVEEGGFCEAGTAIAQIEGKTEALLTGERVALNLAMRLSGIATLTHKYVDQIADLPTKFVDTRKTTPGLRILEKYATRLGGAINHRMGLDDGIMIKDNHIKAAGGIAIAISRLKDNIPYPLTIEVETSNIEEVEEAVRHDADIIMLDNMSLEIMEQAVNLIRQSNQNIKIEASGNITLDTIRPVAETGVDYISSSAPITRSPWLDLSMRFI
jgi:nicotinate-nucleotide pyrophosphorylase (carboxylating)